MATAERDHPAASAPPVRRRRRWPRLLLLLGLGGAGVAALGRRSAPAPAVPAEPLPGRPRLVEVIGGSLPHEQPPEPRERLLHRGRQVLGRAKDVEVRLADPTVSPRHALVEAEADGRVVLRDLGALNGVLVDGVPVAEAELHDGNRLQLGDTRLVYRTDPAEDRGGRSGGELGENIARDEDGRAPDSA